MDFLTECHLLSLPDPSPKFYQVHPFESFGGAVWGTKMGEFMRLGIFGGHPLYMFVTLRKGLLAVRALKSLKAILHWRGSR